MKGGRLKIVNASRYPTEEVERLVRFGLDEIDLKGHRIVAVVKNTKATRGSDAAFSGQAWSYTFPATLYDRYCGRRTCTHHLILVRLGQPQRFPASAFRRYAGVPKDCFIDWREALACVTAHEGMHAQHAYDNGYLQKSGRRKVEVPSSPLPNSRARTTKRYRIVKTRVGVERIEPKCEAFEAYMLRRYRAEAQATTAEGR